MKTLPLWTALITPFDHHKNIDYSSIKALIKLQEEAGNGILLLGSTGEALNIPFDEKKRLAEFVLSQKPSVPVMVGVAGAQLDEQKNWIHFCDRLGADAFLLVTPYYSRPGTHGQIQWFKALAAETTKPCMLYNVPGRTGTRLCPEALKAVSTIKNIYALKEASGSLDDYDAYMQAAPNLAFYSGNDNLPYALCKRGAIGLVSIMSNVYPKLTHSYVQECLKKERTDLIEQCEVSSEHISCLGPIPPKALLYKKGLIESDQVLLPLSSEDLSNQAALNQTDKLLSTLEDKLSLLVI
jgi:4-hydroxy-tetrahydrodipicolinate synthase